MHLTVRKNLPLTNIWVLMVIPHLVLCIPVKIGLAPKLIGSEPTEAMCLGSDLDIMFVVDGSSSINPENFELVKNFVATLAEKFVSSEKQAGTSVGVVQFSGVARTEFSLNSNDQMGELLDSIRNVPHLEGTTNLGLALSHIKDKELLEDRGDRPDVPNLIVVITDGRSKDEPGPVATKLRDAGNKIIAVGVTANLNHDQLLSVSGDPAAVFETSDFKLLDADLVTDINNFIFQCNNSQKVILEKPLMSSVDVDNGSISNLVSSAEPQPICPGSDIDLMFVVDGSSSIHTDRFELVKLFVATLVEMYVPAANDSNTHVGIVQFSWSARTELSLNNQAERDQLLDNIRNITYLQGTTKLGVALSYTKDKELIKDKGDRPDVPNLIIVITDGASQDDPGPAAASLRAAGNKMVVVGVTADVDRDQMLSVAGAPEAVFNVPDFKLLNEELANAIVKYTC